tara:strand:- start:96 stop:1052 length:957 start_codon:yes stop_codon:yes gene_type:complete
MKKLLLLLILITNYSYGQEMNNEPQNFLDLYLKSQNISAKEYVKKHNIKALYVLVNNSGGYSKIDFDTKGNLTSYFLKNEKSISKKEIEYDNQNRISEIRYLDRSNAFVHGTYNVYKNDSTFTYSLKDSTIAEISIKDKFRTMNILYDKNADEGISLDEYFDKNEKKIKEILIQNGVKTITEYKCIDSLKYVTVTKINSLNQEVGSEKYISEKKSLTKNTIEYFKTENKNPYKIESYENDKLVSELFFDKTGNPYKEIIYYRDSGVLNKMKLVNYKTNKKTSYKFKSNRKGMLTDIIKKSESESLSYNFKFLLIKKKK